MNDKRYYWLKLEENYFDIKVQKALRKLPSGAEMLICYLKMQLKYLNKGGLIEFNGICNDMFEEIALDIDEPEELVKMTLGLLTRWHVIEQQNDAVYLTEMQTRIGSKTDVAKRVEKHRKKQELLQCNNDVTKCNSIQEIEIEIDIEKDIEKRFKKPTIQEIKDYCKERNNDVDANRFYNFYESKGWMVGSNKMKDWKSAVRTWEKPNTQPTWLNKTIEAEIATEEEQANFEKLLGGFK